MREECKIVQDLLANYIEGLNNEETNKYVEKHLGNCEDCKEILEAMRKELSVDNEVKEKEVDYFKKYNKKLRIFKSTVLVIILAFILIFCVSTIRKMIIFKNLYNKVEENINDTNYHIQTTTYIGKSIMKTETFKKDDKFISTMNSIIFSNNEISNFRETRYHNGETTNCYFEGYDKSKKVQLNCDNVDKPLTHLHNWFSLDISNLINLLEISMWSDIKLENCNMQECYKIELRHIPEFMYQIKYNNITTDFTFWVNKENGLTIRYMYPGNGIDSVVDYNYSIGTVTDEDIIEPDISEYEIVEDMVN